VIRVGPNCGIATRRVIDLAWPLSGPLCGLAGVILVYGERDRVHRPTGFPVPDPDRRLAVLGGIGQPYGASAALSSYRQRSRRRRDDHPDYKTVVASYL